jgi:hypothetical protein
MKYPISTLSKALDVKQFFRASEWYFLSVLSLYTVLALLFFSEIPIVKTILLENILIAIGLISLAAISCPTTCFAIWPLKMAFMS